MSITIENGVLKKYRGSLSTVTIPDTVNCIGPEAFKYNSDMIQVFIPDSVIQIKEGAFQYCDKLSDVRWPQNLISIGKDAFWGCKALTGVVLPESVTEIGAYAFFECEGLRNVSIPAHLTNIGERAFERCKGLTDNKQMVALGGIIFDYYGAGGEVEIPDGITQIGRCAFSDFQRHYVRKLEKIIFPTSIETIGQDAFYGCDELKSVELPPHLTSIGSGAFQCCKALTSISFPEGLKDIGYNAFDKCESLSYVRFPSSIKTIGKNAFSECVKLRMIELPAGKSNMISYNIMPKMSLPILMQSGEKTEFLAYAAKSDKDNLSDFIKKGDWSAYDLELINNGPKFKYTLPARLVGALGRITKPAKLTDENRDLYIELLKKNAKKLVPLAEEFRCPQTIQTLFQIGILDRKTETEIKKQLTASSVPGIAQLAELKNMANDITVEKIRKTEAKRKTPESPLEKEFAEKFRYIKGDAVIKKMKLVGFSLPVLKMRDGTAAPSDLLYYIVACYCGQQERPYSIVAEADKAAELLEDTSFTAVRDAMSSVSAALPFLCRFGTVEQIRRLIKTIGNADKRSRETLCSTIVLSDTQEAILFLKNYADLKDYAAIRNMQESDIIIDYPLHPAEMAAEELIDTYVTGSDLALYDVAEPIPFDIDGLPCSKQLVVLLLAAYKKQWHRCAQIVYGRMNTFTMLKDGTGVRIIEELDEIAAALNRRALSAFLESLLSGNEYREYILSWARFADEESVTKITKDYSKKIKGHAKEKYYAENLREALLISETRTAMEFADKNRTLNRYAKMRGTDAETLRFTVLTEFGLDTDCRKTYNLGCSTVTATLQPDLTLNLCDAAGNTMKSIPKKNAEPEKYEAAATDLAKIRRDIKKLAKLRNTQLFTSFLDEQRFSASVWKSGYQTNPVMNMLGRLIVWAQDKDTFTLSQNGAIDSQQNAYTIRNTPISIAHPMEMNPNEIIRWQKYFTSNGLRQPFAQIWEPVYKPEEIRQDRYAGIMIPYYRFLNQEKHGISVHDEDFHNIIEIDLQDCTVEIERMDWKRHSIDVNDRFEIKQFKFKKYTRRVNHLVTYFDRVTVWDRIRKDDSDVMIVMDHFTLAQLMEFIKVAQESNAVNTLALLLEYKDSHYADYDPLDDFTLEW